MHDIAHAAADAARVPRFDDVLARGRQRRARRRGLATGAAGLAVAAILGVTQVVGGSGGGGPQPAPNPSPSTETTDAQDPTATAEAIVADPSARLSQVEIEAGSQAAAAVWDCDLRECSGVRGSALAVTTDWFVNAKVVPMRGRVISVRSLGDGAFHVRGARGFGEVVHVDGRREPVVETDAPGAGTPVVMWKGAVRHLYLVDPDTAMAHRLDVSAPDAVLELPDGRIVVYGETGIRVSSDEGASWATVEPAPGTPDALFGLVPAATSDIVLVEGSDGATLFPFQAVHYETGGRFVRVVQDTDPMRYLGGQVVLPDGRLLIHVLDWSDDDMPSGYYVSVGEDWSSFTPVGGPPDSTGDVDGADPLAVSVTAGTVRVVARGAPGSDTPAWLSEDGGETWERFAGR